MTNDADQFPRDFGGMNYASASPYGSAPTLVKLAGIFNIVMACLDILYGLVMAFLIVMLATGAITQKQVAEANGGQQLPPMGVIVGVFGVVTAVIFIVGIIKLIAGIRLVRVRRGAWGLGLAAGIMGCLQLWCSWMCVIPLAVGVFTIVVMSLGNVRRYLREVPGAA